MIATAFRLVVEVVRAARCSLAASYLRERRRRVEAEEALRDVLCDLGQARAAELAHRRARERAEDELRAARGER